jgi:hypothetical protein
VQDFLQAKRIVADFSVQIEGSRLSVPVRRQRSMQQNSAMPVETGVQLGLRTGLKKPRIPASAGMTRLRVDF